MLQSEYQVVFLEDIIASKLREVVRRKQDVPVEGLVAQAEAAPPALSLARALRGKNLKLIAEVKKASPSRGLIREDFQPVAMAKAYVTGGAAAISVLTEEQYFQGGIAYLSGIKKAPEVKVPVLRKDFILDAYQVYEARACGADAVLLIVACLKKTVLAQLLTLSGSLGMDVLVEAHNRQELTVALEAGAYIIGINNRNLETFEVDLEVTRRLRPLIPPGVIAVSESGIRVRADMAVMRDLGLDAVLVGEALSGAPDIPAKMKELLGED